MIQVRNTIRAWILRFHRRRLTDPNAAAATTSLQCSAETAGKIDAKVLEIIKEAHAKARAILADNREKLDELANFLLEKETITGEEFMALLNGEEQELAVVEEQQA